MLRLIILYPTEIGRLQIGSLEAESLQAVTSNDGTFIASLDTGSNLEVEIFEHHLRDTTNSFEITGARGSEQSGIVPISGLEMAGVLFRKIETSSARIGNTIQLRQGNIGNGILKRFVVSFDYPNREVIFEY